MQKFAPPHKTKSLLPILSMIKQPPNVEQIVSGKRSLSFSLTLEILGEALAHKI
jgi:hypothetical protein